jgi:hypothetical protein
MVPIRKGAFLRKVKDITLSSALTVSLLGSTALMQSCDPNTTQQEQEIAFTRGIETHIQETERGVFKITDERVVAENETKAIVQFLNGQTDTLSVETARRIVNANPEDWNSDSNGSNNNQTVHQGYYGGGLSSVLMYGGMGYFLGRSMNSQPVAGYYANPGVYSRAQQNFTTVQNSRVARPVNSSKGYFRSGTRSSGSA